MKANVLKKKYLDFFKTKDHKVIPSASLIPENDPTVLFTTAGMHPLVPYLMGQKHPLGNKIVDVQKCIRTGDINEVGDNSHLTFFEMLGNWSLGDYFKKEAIEYSFEFLTDKKWLNLDIDKLAISIFKGDKNAPKDDFSYKTWLDLGIKKERISFLPKKDNWWGPAGLTGPCGPCTEMFYWTSKEKAPKKFDVNNSKWFEIWNDVFMEYNKTKDGKYELLKQKNVDTGMGVERTAAILQNKESVFDIELFTPIIKKIKDIANIKKENESQLKSIRIITDHLRAAAFILGDEKRITPSNVEQGYVLRRLIRKSIRHGKLLGITDNFTLELAKSIIPVYKDNYEEIGKYKKFILEEFDKEEEKFTKTIDKGTKRFEKILLNLKSKRIPGIEAFHLYDTYGFPIELTKELADERGFKIDEVGFDEEFKKHQEKSRLGTEKRFSSGLSDHSVDTTRLHTATHLLHQSLRKVLGSHVQQKGSNITPERLRFDFSHDKKLTDVELKKVEYLVNEQIKKKIEVKREEMSPSEAKNKGALGFFESKYGDIVSVYTIGKFSKEICTGPHVKNTKEIKNFKIKKEEAIAAGIRRIRAIVD
jgi:alanyl-tRNA synthetase